MLVFILIVMPVLGTTVTWTGAAENSRWDTPSNWSPGHIPFAGDDVVFTKASVAATSIVYTPFGTTFVKSITCPDNVCATFTLEGTLIVVALLYPFPHCIFNSTSALSHLTIGEVHPSDNVEIVFAVSTSVHSIVLNQKLSDASFTLRISPPYGKFESKAGIMKSTNSSILAVVGSGKEGECVFTNTGDLNATSGVHITFKGVDVIGNGTMQVANSGSISVSDGKFRNFGNVFMDDGGVLSASNAHVHLPKLVYPTKVSFSGVLQTDGKPDMALCDPNAMGPYHAPVTFYLSQAKPCV